MSRKVGSIVVEHRPAAPVTSPLSQYVGLEPGSTVLPMGHVRAEGRAAFRVDTIFDRDIAIPMRDGVLLRADIFRPVTSDQPDGKVPVVVSWSPYGKTGTGFFSLDLTPGRAGVPKARTSGYEKFEAPDPAEWTAKGYAVFNIDTRGVFDSQADIRFFGIAEGQDGHDTVEHLATLPWCSGSVALAGNSWLAMAQWFIAAEQPPHLKCIAPMEGASDLYREILAREGVPDTPSNEMLVQSLYGRNLLEDPIAMVRKYPDYNEYWEDKRANFDKIKVPAYIIASWSTGLHTEGSIRAHEEFQAPKWLRVHSTQEWYDLYSPECNDELQSFLDR